VQDAGLPVDVATFQAEQFLRSQAGPDGDDRERPIARVELGGDGADFVPRLERPDFAPLVPLPLRVLDPRRCVPGRQSAFDPPSEGLPERAKDAVTRSGRESLPPVLDLDTVQTVRRPVAKLGPCFPQLRCQVPFRGRVDGAPMLLEEQVEQRVDRLRPLSDPNRGEPPRRAATSSSLAPSQSPAAVFVSKPPLSRRFPSASYRRACQVPCRL
jgi:hypothetical protein